MLTFDEVLNKYHRYRVRQTGNMVSKLAQEVGTELRLAENDKYKSRLAIHIETAVRSTTDDLKHVALSPGQAAQKSVTAAAKTTDVLTPMGESSHQRRAEIAPDCEPLLPNERFPQVAMFCLAATNLTTFCVRIYRTIQRLIQKEGAMCEETIKKHKLPAFVPPRLLFYFYQDGNLLVKPIGHSHTTLFKSNAKLVQVECQIFNTHSIGEGRMSLAKYVVAVLLTLITIAPVDAATTVPTSLVVGRVSKTFNREKNGNRIPVRVNFVEFSILASHGSKLVRATVNGQEMTINGQVIQEKYTNSQGFYQSKIDASNLNLMKDQVNVFRFFRPNGSVNIVRVKNEIDLLYWPW